MEFLMLFGFIIYATIGLLLACDFEGAWWENILIGVFWGPLTAWFLLAWTVCSFIGRDPITLRKI